MPKSIYIHLPFCKTKCPYCDFASFAGQDEKRQSYIEALLAEIDLRAKQINNTEIQTIFFGGGTPSIHPAAEIQSILSKLQNYFSFAKDIEISLEANPGTTNQARLQELKDIGINRISIGVQTFDPNLLIKLGRGHSLEDSYRVIEEIQAVNFNSWSFDLIYGLPGQDLKSWADTLDIAMKLNPYHISAYGLSIEKNTPYGAIYKDYSHQDLPQEDEIVEMYELAHKTFMAHGLRRYEISNWAKPAHEAKHNLTYWRAEEYLALGLSAHGYIANTRYHNTRDLDEYIKTINNTTFSSIEETIDKEEQLEEKILLGLRLEEGIILNEKVKNRINLNAFKELSTAGFIQENNDRIKLSDKAIMVSNKIIAKLLS